MVCKIYKAKTQDHLGNDQAISKTYGETRNISGVLLSAVEQRDGTRQKKVKKLIEKFENHKLEESFLQNLSQTQQINLLQLSNKSVIFTESDRVQPEQL